MFNQNIISNKSDLNWSTMFSYTLVTESLMTKISQLNPMFESLLSESLVTKSLENQNQELNVMAETILTKFAAIATKSHN
jgi:hypothetical protein